MGPCSGRGPTGPSGGYFSATGKNLPRTRPYHGYFSLGANYDGAKSSRALSPGGNLRTGEVAPDVASVPAPMNT